MYPSSSAGIDGPTSIVLVITDVTPVSGQQQEDNDGNAYVELQATKQPDPARYSRALPAGARVVAYLVPAADGAPDARTDGSLANPAAGRPAGQALYLPAGPQGLAIQSAEGNRGVAAHRGTGTGVPCRRAARWRNSSANDGEGQ